jgi:hypothetical protein
MNSTDRRDASGGRGSSLPRTPTGRVAVAGTPEYLRTATAPVAGAAQQDPFPNRPTAGNGGMTAMAALPASSGVPAVDRKSGSPRGRAPSASGAIA